METLFQYQAREVSRKTKWQKRPYVHSHLNGEENLKGKEWDTRISAYQIVLPSRRTFSTLCSFPSPNLDRISPPKKNAKQKVLLSFHSDFLYQNPFSSHFHLCFSLLQLWKVPPSTSEISSINTSHNHEVSFSHHIYSLTSPPRIHMDSWWTARNPNQGPKWTQNISQDRSGAYGPKPCRI